MRLPRIKCRNQACLLNESNKCGSPCRGREDFSCMNMNVEKTINADIKETKRQVRVKSWRDTVGKARYIQKE